MLVVCEDLKVALANPLILALADFVLLPPIPFSLPQEDLLWSESSALSTLSCLSFPLPLLLRGLHLSYCLRTMTRTVVDTFSYPS